MRHLQHNTTLQGGKYRIERVLGQGGFGNTYVGFNTTFEERVAIKEFFMQGINDRDDATGSITVSLERNKPQFEEQLEKFKKEALRIRKLDNPHIVKVHDLFVENGTAYYVMDYIDGENLAEHLKRTGKPMTEPEVREILPQILDALKTVHDAGFWHLDLKPANIMLTKGSKVKLIDFGASKQLNAQKGGATTSTAISYTNGFAPREQMEQNYDKFGPWTDIYALGATLYNLLTNKRPPLPTDIDDDASEDKHNSLPLPESTSEEMKSLILWMMQTDRNQRPQNINAICCYFEGIDSANESINEQTLLSESNEKICITDDSSESKNMTLVKTNRTNHRSGNKRKRKRRLLYVSLLFVFITVIVIAYINLSNVPTSGYNYDTKNFFKVINSYDDFGEYSEGMIPVVKDNKYGYINTDGEECVPCIYDKVFSFKNGLARVSKDNKYGFINVKGDLIVPFIYDNAYDFDDIGLANVCKGDLWGFIDVYGNDVISCKYDYDSQMNNSGVWKNSAYLNYTSGLYIYKKTGCRWDNNGVAVILNGGLFGVIDKSGRQIIPCKYLSIDIDFNGSEEIFVVKELNEQGEMKYGMVDNNEKILLPSKYDEIGKISEGVVTVKKDNKYTYWSIFGGFLWSLEYEKVSEFSNGIACVKQNGKYMYINKFEKKVLPQVYDDASIFSDLGLAVVKGNGKYGCINRDGIYVIPAEYDYIYSFEEGFALAKKNQKFGVINMKGDVVIPFEFDNIILNIKEGLSCVLKNKKYGFADNSGKMVVPCIYDYAENFKDGLAKVIKGRRNGIIDRFGNSTFDYSTAKQKALEILEPVDDVSVIEDVLDSIN